MTVAYTYATLWWGECSSCESRSGYAFSREDLPHVLVNEGWNVQGDRLLCPKCEARQQPPEHDK